VKGGGKMAKMSTLDNVVKTLVIVGAINWGLDAYGLNVVDALLGSWPTVVKVVYTLVGLSGLKMLYDTFN
jgi:uncharacterized membrane protein YuzA (DUF378 family)